MKRKLFFLILCLPLYVAQAQHFLSIDTIYGNTFTTQLNQNLSIPVRVRAYDSLFQLTTWQGVVDYYVLTDSMIASLQSPRLFYSSPFITIDSANGYNDTLILDILPQEMRIGGNVIIVWPASASPNVFPKDSAEADVLVTGSSEIEGKGEYSQILVYPNPTTETLIVRGVTTNWIKAELLDMKGRCLAIYYVDKLSSQEIDLRSVPSGMFVIRILLQNGTQLTRLVMKR